ncbi:glycosyltransferase [Bacillaceae bacterium IKA-2]|nr:glycosyltransferase [Bacillaceae bacterium IKA-2]
MRKKIKDYNLIDHFILLGSNPNPYPFIKNCDIYVQPSRYEGYCITTMEAKCLNKPIITTDVNGAREQIIPGQTGLIVSIDEEELYKGIKELINNESLRRHLTGSLKIINDEIEIRTVNFESVI